MIRDGAGIIGLTFCPGKKHHGLYSGVWDRDLAVDLQAIQAFGARTLVTLMDGSELDAVGVPVGLLSSTARDFGLEWHHLPIKDVHTPDSVFEDLWTYSGLRLRSALARGERIVVHCRGGLGRTGTVAGLLLVEFGDEPKTAVKKIRAARPGSIETTDQEKFIENWKPIAFARVQHSQEERVLGSLLGGAVGDALGYAVEVDKLDEIRERFGEGGIKEPILKQGKLIVSDDTQMTLFTLDGLLNSLEKHGPVEKPQIVQSIRAAYLDWLDTQTVPRNAPRKEPAWLSQQPEMHFRRAPGNTCLSALGLGGNGTMSEPINSSKGCGGAMRVAPIGLIGAGDDTGTVFQLASETAALTHGHTSGYLSAGMVASIVRLLINGTSPETHLRSYSDLGAVDQSCQILRTYPGHEETLAAVKEAVGLAAKGLKDHPKAVETLGGGWVGEEALAIALYSVLSADSFVEAVSIAATHSGDSDSTASIAGQFWGAMKGLGGIPHDWIRYLDVLSPLLHLARRLIASGFR